MPIKFQNQFTSNLLASRLPKIWHNWDILIQAQRSIAEEHALSLVIGAMMNNQEEWIIPTNNCDNRPPQQLPIYQQQSQNKTKHKNIAPKSQTPLVNNGLSTGQQQCRPASPVHSTSGIISWWRVTEDTNIQTLHTSQIHITEPENSVNR